MKKITAQHSLSAISHQLSAKKAESRKLMTEGFEKGFSSLAAVASLGLILALFLGLVGTGTIKLPGKGGIPTSPIPNLSDPVEDDQACNDPKNADCEHFIYKDPEDLTPAQIQQELEKN